MRNTSLMPTSIGSQELDDAGETRRWIRLARLGGGTAKLRDILLARCAEDGQSSPDLENADYSYGRFIRSYSWFESIVTISSTLVITAFIVILTSTFIYFLGWDGPSFSPALIHIGLGSIAAAMVCISSVLVCVEIIEARLRNERRRKQHLTTSKHFPPPLWRLFPRFTFLGIAIFPALLAFRLHSVFGSVPLPEHPPFAFTPWQTGLVIGLSLAIALIMLFLIWAVSPVSDVLYSRFRPAYAFAQKLSAVRIAASDWSTQEAEHCQQKYVVRRMIAAADILDDYCWRKYRYRGMGVPARAQNAINVLRGFGRLWDDFDKRDDLIAEVERAIIMAARGRLDGLFIRTRPLRTRSSDPSIPRLDPRQRTTRRLRSILPFARISLLLTMLAVMLPKGTLSNWLFDLMRSLPKLLRGLGT